MKVRPFKYVLLLLAATVTFFSCERNDPVPAKPARTLFVYMMAENSLSGYGDDNITKMLEGVTADALNGGNLVVYFDPRNAEPELFRISVDKQGVAEKQVIKTYEEHNSVSPEVVTGVFNDVLTDPCLAADSYGLILWSHGTAWLPSNYTSLLKAFGQDGSNWMEITELADVIPDNVFDFIIFDACYMASIEVAYELRDKANYIVASPTEILASGFPYDLIMPSLFKKEADLVSVCKDFFNYYDQQSGIMRSATISLVDTRQLENLGAVTRAILQGKEAEVKVMPVSGGIVQPLDMLTSRRLLYDFGDFMTCFAGESGTDAFAAAMDKAIIYENTTSYSTYNGGSQLKMERFSGLNSYIPRENFTGLNEWYARLEWYKAVYE